MQANRINKFGENSNGLHSGSTALRDYGASIFTLDFKALANIEVDENEFGRCWLDGFCMTLSAASTLSPPAASRLICINLYVLTKSG